MYPGIHAQTTPDKPAVIVAETGEATSYAELESRSARFARWLHGQGLRTGDHVAVVSVNDPVVFELYWGVIRSGMYFTAVNINGTPDDIAHIVNDCGARVLLISAELSDLAGQLVTRSPGVRLRVSLGGPVDGHTEYAEAVAGVGDRPLADQPRGSDMLYSSGTTGRPKGIKPVLSGLQVGEQPGTAPTELMRSAYAAGPGTVYLSPAPIYHAAPLRFGAATQALGGTVILMKRFDAEASLRCIEQYRVTISQWVPTHFIRLLRLPDEIRARYDVSSQRHVVHAAAPCPVEVKEKMMRWWGEILYEYYSSTESVGMTAIGPEEWRRKPGSVGQSGPHSTGIVHICGDDGAELAPNTVGDIYFERAGYSFEYHNDPEKTRESRHPRHPGWATNGDVGYLDEDDFLFLTDRKKFTIISGGVNIYPQEIENCLSVHPKVFDVAVVGVPDDEMGQSVKAIVQPAPGVDTGDELAAELIAYTRVRLAHYKCPRTVDFVAELPRTPTGKLVKGKLAAGGLHS
ncbi:acyl-CoA synthetase [Rhodococcus opacus]|uniref:acyl-CoA synthetase n=1 Tax=Rhodococcus opacus TaxID=37919 RepID=UPI001C493250|nr:acyl-CoA synthetase [Rhodococcus opacus]MBV6756246.1 acyl-CoA synthetase [Rhodococcus opacus]